MGIYNEQCSYLNPLPPSPLYCFFVEAYNIRLKASLSIRIRSNNIYLSFVAEVYLESSIVRPAKQDAITGIRETES